MKILSVRYNAGYGGGRYNILCVGSTPSVRETPYNVQVTLRDVSFPPPLKGRSALSKRLPPFVSRNDTNIMEWLDLNLVGMCEIQVFCFLSQPAQGQGLPIGCDIIASLNFSNEADAVYAKFVNW